MPYRRRYPRRRFNYRRQPLRRRVARVQRQVSTMTRMSKAEANYYDVPVSSTNINTTPTIIQITGQMPQGVGVGQRQGNSVLVRSIFVRFTLTVSSLDVNNNVRVIIFQDKNATGGTPIGPAGVLQSASGTFAYLSPLANSERGRWKIYHDRTYNLTVNAATATRDIKKFIPFKKPKLVTFNGDSTGPQRGNFYMLLVSDSSAASDPLFIGYFRTRFNDGGA